MAPEGVVWATRTVPAVAARAVCGATKDPMPPAAASSSGADMPEHRAVAQELAPADTPGAQFVDQIVLRLRSTCGEARPDTVRKPLISSSPCLLALLPCARHVPVSRGA